MLMTIIGILVGLVILGCAVVALYIAMQGDAEMRLLTKKRTDAVKVSEAGDRLDFQLEVPFDNIGKQEGTILDTYMRIYLPQEQYDDVFVMFTSGALGTSWFGTTPEQSDLMSGATANVSITDVGVAVTTTKETDPVNVNTKVSMIFLPSFEAADQVFILDVSTS